MVHAVNRVAREIPAIKIGRLVLVPVDGLERLLAGFIWKLINEAAGAPMIPTPRRRR